MLEHQPQSKLQVPRIQRPSSFSEQRIGDVVVSTAACRGQQEVGPVEDVKARCFKLQVGSLRQLESLRQGHIGYP